MRRFFLSFIGLLVLSLVFTLSSSAENTKQVKVLSVNETIDQDYFSFGNRSELNGVVNGDAYVIGGEVEVTGEVNGDLLTAGGSVVISGKINGDVRVAGGNVTFSGAQITGNVTVGGGNVTFDSGTVLSGSIVAIAANLQVFAPIGKGATIAGGSVLLANSVGGDVSAGATSLSLSNGTQIEGDLTYYSENEASISEGASVSGEIKREAPKQGEVSQVNINEAGKGAGIALAGVVYAIKIIDIFWLIIIGLILIYLFPVFTKKTADVATHKLGWAFLGGLGVLIFMPIIAILFMLSLVGIPISFILLFAFFIIFWMGRIFVIYAIGLFILEKLNKKDHRGMAYILGIIIYIILSVIPIVDFIAGFIISVAGVGALVITKGQIFKDLRDKKLL